MCQDKYLELSKCIVIINSITERHNGEDKVKNSDQLTDGAVC